jgi:hypothetical protein
MAENEQAETGGPQAQPQEPAEEPKIIIDDDWKAQARAEKEKLAKEVEGEGGAAPAAARGARGPRELPEASFSTLVNSIITQAFMAMGGMQDRSGRRYVDLEVAKHHIDTLVVLDEKAKGNLTDEEKKLLDQGLYQCRMQYVNIAQRVSSMPAPGGATPPQPQQ